MLTAELLDVVYLALTLKIENVKGYAMRAGPKALAVPEKKQTLFLQTLQKHNIIITL